MTTIKKTDKQALAEWEIFKANISNSTPIDLSEDATARRKRMAKLEADPEAWFKYYFPKYSFAPPADFHKASTRRIMRAEKHFYQRRAWARGLAKSTRRMMEVFYIMFVKKLRINALLISKSEGNAVRLLDTYMVNLEANNRIINDYGVQEKAGKWTQGEFTTRKGCTFRAVGAEQNPRGAKNEELRINVLIFDDVDDDEVCRNPERLQVRWLWIEQAVIPTVDISAVYYIFFDNNIIAEDSLAVRAAEYADDVELVNIRDANGVSTWIEKNSEEDIDAILKSISWASSQKEYFNNPITQGKSFKEMTYGNCPPYRALDCVIIYADPSPSDKDKPSAKAKVQQSCKAVGIISCYNNKVYVHKAWVDQVSNSTFLDWLYEAKSIVTNAAEKFGTLCIVYIENNTLQDPFYQQALLPKIAEKDKILNTHLNAKPDDRIKPPKWPRIEALLEPLNRNGNLILNKEEKDNPHMKRLDEQFRSAGPNTKIMDGPDMVEGGAFIAIAKARISTNRTKLGVRKPNSKRI